MVELKATITGRMVWTRAKSATIRALLYFDIFSYPLTLEEIHAFCQTELSLTELSDGVKELVASGLLFKYSSLYSTSPESAIYERRISGNRYAESQIVRARKISKFLGAFPFVEGVAISGSLSKNYADRHSDIDYFIITRPDRLWIARSLMHLFKKLTFLVGKQHDYCMNYYLDSEHLELKDNNLYIALEALTLVPTYGLEVLEKFTRMNNWVFSFYPNAAWKSHLGHRDGKPFLSVILQAAIDLTIGSWLNKMLMRITERKWRKKWLLQGKRAKEFDEAMRTTPYESKNHPNDYQKHILSMYQEKLKAFEEENGLSLSLS